MTSNRRMEKYEDSMEKLQASVSKMAKAGFRAGVPTSTKTSSSAEHNKDDFAGSPSDDLKEHDGDLESSELHGAYVQIRDSVQKVQLPPRLSLGDTGPSVRGEARKMVTFIRKCAGFTTTMLKVFKSVSDKIETEEADWDSLFTCVTALHRTFQSEQTASIFEGSGVPTDTLQLYRFLAKNTSITDQEARALENATRLSTAINMAKASGSGNNNYQRGRGNRRFDSSFRGRGGNFRGFNRGSQGQGSSDYFDSAVASTSSAKP